MNLQKSKYHKYIKTFKEDRMSKAKRKKCLRYEEVMLQMEKYVNYFSRQISLPNYMDIEDIKQEMRLNIFQACKSYRSDSNAKLTTYFIHVLKMKKLSLIKSIQRKINYDDKKINNLEILDTRYSTGYFLEDFNRKFVERSALDIMPTQRARVMYQYFKSGLSIKQIAKKINRSNSKVNMIKNREIIPSLRNAYNNFKEYDNFCLNFS